MATPGSVLAAAWARWRSLRRSDRVRLLVFMVLFGSAALVVLAGGAPDADAARAWVAERGGWASTVFILGFAALTSAPFPKSVLAVAGGALWGLGPGLLICMGGVLLGATGSFLLGRHVLSSSIRTLVGARMSEVDAAVNRSFVAVLAIRVMPVLPFTLLNYAFGVTAIRYVTFALTTAIGSCPGTAAYVAVGALGFDVTSWQFWAALAAIASMSLIGVVLAARRRGSSNDRVGADLSGHPRGAVADPRGGSSYAGAGLAELQ